MQYTESLLLRGIPMVVTRKFLTFKYKTQTGLSCSSTDFSKLSRSFFKKTFPT